MSRCLTVCHFAFLPKQRGLLLRIIEQSKIVMVLPTVSSPTVCLWQDFDEEKVKVPATHRWRVYVGIKCGGYKCIITQDSKGFYRHRAAKA